MIVDSCILIDFLNHVEAAREFVRAKPNLSASIVSRIEVLAGVHDPELRSLAETLFEMVEWHSLTIPIADRAALIRRERKLKLPDAVIRATAELHGLQIVTRNTRDFPADDPRVLVPYTLN